MHVSALLDLAPRSKPFVFLHEKNIACGKLQVFSIREREEMARESARLAIALSAQAPVFVVNTLESEEEFGETLRSFGASRDLPIEAQTYFDASVAERYEEIRDDIIDTNAKAVIFNSFESGVQTARHRDKFVLQLRALAKELRIAVIVFTKEPLERLLRTKDIGRGAMGMLLFYAEEPQELGCGSDELQGHEPLYKKFAREYEAEVAANPPPPDPINEIPFWEFTDEETIGPESWNAIMKELKELGNECKSRAPIDEELAANSQQLTESEQLAISS
jgi:hypothetical protein